MATAIQPVAWAMSWWGVESTQCCLFCWICPVSHYTRPKSAQAAADTRDRARTLEGAEEKKEETDGNIQVIQFLIQKKNPTDSATEFSQCLLSRFPQLTFTGKAELPHKLSIQVTLPFLLQPHDSLDQSKERWGQTAIFLQTTEKDRQSKALSEASLWCPFIAFRVRFTTFWTFILTNLHWDKDSWLLVFPDSKTKSLPRAEAVWAGDKAGTSLLQSRCQFISI